MRIIHWSDCYPPFRGGTETVVCRLATAMAAEGHDVLVVTNGAEGLAPHEKVQGVAIHRFPFRAALEASDPHAILQALKGVAAVKREFVPDVIHLHFNGPSCFFHLRTHATRPCPVLVTIHGGLGDCSGGARNALGQLLDTADWVSGVSHAMVAEAIAVSPLVAMKSSVIYNGDHRARPIAPRAEPPILFCFGRHVPDKGFDLAIAAMPAIRAMYPDVRLVIASDGPERVNLEKQAQSLGLGEAVCFVGWVDEAALQQWIDRASIIIVPSRWAEGFGLVALEAALAARPVIATAVGGLPEVVRDGRTGIIVPPHHAAAIADAALRLLDDPAWSRALGENARADAARFGLRAQLDSFIALYARLQGRADAA
ncbi:glycosyltransferase family 4 protein [Flavisphingomonas formosensis]|uniref:glycosyltransferase family 4 protein n=1 Tax=Flavisphingomonas formosensis TaxID=861534 RepID=UPI0012F9C0B4|nr:glycosyltransferase family 4 protein [Sphingomonas formosensis]